MTMRFIDVSGWQPGDIGDIVEHDGLIAKATEGVTFSSGVCAQQVASAVRRGKKHGTYHFARPGDAAAQADCYLAKAGAYVGKGWLVLDIEDNAVSNKQEFVRGFVRRVGERAGIVPVVYSYTSYIKAAGLAAVCKELGAPLWIAQYGANAAGGYMDPGSPPMECVAWQYKSAGRLDGYAKNLDLNVFYGDAADWDRLAGASVSAPVPPAGAVPQGPPDGWHQESDGWHYRKGGSDASGWMELEDKWYLFGTGGQMLTGWQSVSGKWYYLSGSGSMLTGWLKDKDNVWYWLDSSGAMAAGDAVISGKTHRFSSSGAWEREL